MPEIAPLRAGDPRSLGPYRLVGLLGEGGQGSVYLGEEAPEEDSAAVPEEASGGEAAGEAGEKEAPRRVAVKLLHARLTGDARARARFAAELEVARRVAAFCTAPILDADVEGDRPYIVSEYIDGPSLSQVVASDGTRSGADLDRLAIGTMTALAAIHQAGVVHRDFKPANVLLAPDGPRVIDFGIARALDATGTLSSTAVGTPAYMAPEQITGAPIGPQADIWAWGATMIYAASGRPPFGQDSIPTVMHRILNFPPDLGSLTEPLRGLVQACLNKQAAYRPSSQQVLTHLLSLAGSLPGAANGGAQPAAILNQGAEAASTHTNTRLAASLPATPVTPPPAPVPVPPPSVPQPPAPYAAPPQQQPWGQAGTLPWPGTDPAPPAGKPGRRGIGVLAGAGSAALVALILGAGVLIATLRDGDGPSGGTTGRTGGELRMSLSTLSTDSSTGLSPSSALYGTERLVVKQLFTGLVEAMPDGTFQNRAATRITPDATCTSWRIDLRTGTTFSNGEPVTPESFIRGWDRAARDPAGLASLLIGGVKGFDDVQSGRSRMMTGLRGYGSGFQVDLASPDCEFAQKLGDPSLAPVPEAAGAHDNSSYNDRPIGNGPFRVENHVKNRSITLVRNDSWAYGKTKLDRVTIELSGDAAAAGRAGFEEGRYQWVTLDPQHLGTVPRSSAMVSRTLQGLNYLIPITARGPMKSREARLAVSYALDREALSKLLYGGVYAPATGLVPSSIPGFGQKGRCPSCDRTDPARARQLAQQAGLGTGAEVPLYVRNLPNHQRLGQAVRDQLQRNLGWSVTIRVVGTADFRTFAKEIASGDAEGLATFAWLPDYPSARAILHPLLGGDQVATADNGLNNYSLWRDARFDELLSAAVRERSDATRRRHLQEAEKRALDDMAIVPVVFSGAAGLRSDRLVGLRLDLDGHPTLATAAFK